MTPTRHDGDVTMFDPPLELRKPGLLITATDTGVGKTVAACAIAAALRREDPSRVVGVSKPFVTGCRRDREGLVGEDTEALAHFADCRHPLDVISPVRFAAPLAPAVAAEQAGRDVDLEAVRRNLTLIDSDSDLVLVEGVGGLLVPLAPKAGPAQPLAAWWTVLDLTVALDYPVLVVARAGLGTLNHTAMTVRLLRGAGCRIAGLIINGYEADAARTRDESVALNRTWLARFTGAVVAAVLPQCGAVEVSPRDGRLPDALLDAAATCDWSSLARPPRRR